MIRVFIFLLSFPILSFAQDTPEDEVDKVFTISTPLTIDLGKEDPVYEKKNKKAKKNIYYGIKTKKKFTRKGAGSRITLELFNTLKKPQSHNVYVRDIYYFDAVRKKINKTKNYTAEKGPLLHGPYIKKINNITIEQGAFYIGSKHSRWIKKDKKGILVDKEKYYKGWAKDSKATFYDVERTKIRELIPFEYGKKEGNYFYFFPTGKIAVYGEFRYGEKIGKWSLFYDNKRVRKEREIQYRKNPFDDNFKPYILKEWNNKGEKIYDSIIYKKNS